MSRHTPGPWAADSDNYIDSKNGVIAKVELWRNVERASDAEETAANARLIAAAPELLERLRDLVTQIELSNGYDDRGHKLTNLMALHQSRALLAELDK